MRHDDYKLIEYFERGTVQLFNLRIDPGELHDLAQAEHERVATLRAELHDWRRKVSAQMMEPNPAFPGFDENSGD